MDAPSLARRIDALLPQTQCTRCGYPGCSPYADAVARGEADIDRCPPGGQAGVDALAGLLGRPSKGLDPAVGLEAPLRVARIDESSCIGCTLCIQACPVDAIVGAPKRMHAVVAQWCSGCDLCVAPCPVDCIAMVDAGRAWSAADARDARARFEARGARIGCEPAERGMRLASESRREREPQPRSPSRPTAPIGREAGNGDRLDPHALATLAAGEGESAAEAQRAARKQAVVAAALERARARRRAAAQTR